MFVNIFFFITIILFAGITIFRIFSLAIPTSLLNFILNIILITSTHLYLFHPNFYKQNSPHYISLILSYNSPPPFLYSNKIEFDQKNSYYCKRFYHKQHIVYLSLPWAYFHNLVRLKIRLKFLLKFYSITVKRYVTFFIQTWPTSFFLFSIFLFFITKECFIQKFFCVTL